MEVIIFITFLFFSLFSLGIAFYSKKAVYCAIFAGIMFILLGTNLIDQGITVTTHETIAQSWLQQTTGNDTAYNTSSSIISGYTDVITTYKDAYIQGIGFGLWIIGMLSFILPAYYYSQGSEDEKEEE